MQEIKKQASLTGIKKMILQRINGESWFESG